MTVNQQRHSGEDGGWEAKAVLPSRRICAGSSVPWPVPVPPPRPRPLPMPPTRPPSPTPPSPGARAAALGKRTSPSLHARPGWPR